MKGCRLACARRMVAARTEKRHRGVRRTDAMEAAGGAPYRHMVGRRRGGGAYLGGLHSSVPRFFLVFFKAVRSISPTQRKVRR